MTSLTRVFVMLIYNGTSKFYIIKDDIKWAGYNILLCIVLGIKKPYILKLLIMLSFNLVECVIIVKGSVVSVEVGNNSNKCSSVYFTLFVSFNNCIIPGFEVLSILFANFSSFVYGTVF